MLHLKYQSFHGNLHIDRLVERGACWQILKEKEQAGTRGCVGTVVHRNNQEERYKDYFGG